MRDLGQVLPHVHDGEFGISEGPALDGVYGWGAVPAPLSPIIVVGMDQT
jgi:hypothetical protein